MKFLVLVVFAVCFSVASARHRKICGSPVPPCSFDKNYDPINIQRCPKSPVCHGKIKLFRNDDGCCCNVDDNIEGHEGQPDDLVPTTLGECSFNENNKISGGFMNPCPESSECPPNMHLVLEEFADDLFRVGRCCCAPSPEHFEFV